MSFECTVELYKTQFRIHWLFGTYAFIPLFCYLVCTLGEIKPCEQIQTFRSGTLRMITKNVGNIWLCPCKIDTILSKPKTRRNYCPELCIVCQFSLFKLFKCKAFFMSATVFFSDKASPNSFSASAIL